jgi:hypothetical protein
MRGAVEGDVTPRLLVALMYCVDVHRGADKRFTRPRCLTQRSLSMKSETDRMGRYSHYSTALFQALRPLTPECLTPYT